jgi:hypothetical protein
MGLLYLFEALLYMSVTEFLVPSCNRTYVSNGTTLSIRPLIEWAAPHSTYTLTVQQSAELQISICFVVIPVLSSGTQEQIQRSVHTMGHRNQQATVHHCSKPVVEKYQM